ncbi:hypothetical protein PoB_004834200 [Plakobranchus ocellatus]|uniref:Uncharacterized protein n=1 Tax=Plakobranchus ocellatus TaxID=259542 RepID=A0AAV4BR70_9GAST|nr:hypothetical protein PoB_004834200 [Plakobranchus ocellatus]
MAYGWSILLFEAGLLALQARTRDGRVHAYLSAVKRNLAALIEGKEQVSGLKHLDQSVIPHPLEGLTQAACERNSPSKGTHCADLQRCDRATLELYSQQRVWDLEIGPNLIQRKLITLLSRLGRRERPWRHVDTIVGPSPPHPSGSTPSSIRVSPHGKQGAHTVGVSLSISSTEGYGG